mgnify:CR=1 FL=1|tara:strand:+ start:983 stop:1777 length:795 start_codon:yes stop_codon:yes gene_type:complete
MVKIDPMANPTRLKVALVQTSLFWESPQKNRKSLAKTIHSFSSHIDLIVLPEMFTTGFTMNPKNIAPREGQLTLEWMQHIAKEKDAAITGSFPYVENNTYYNRLFFVIPNGEYYTYDKKHTFTLAGEDKIYKAGDKKIIIPYKGFLICPLICYDLRFPVWSRNTENYDVLLYIANWPKQRIHAWDILLKARAIENVAYCIGVNRIGTDNLGYEYTGHSAVYDCLGKELAFSTTNDVIFTVLEKAHIDETRTKLMFLEDKDTFTL